MGSYFERQKCHGEKCVHGFSSFESPLKPPTLSKALRDDIELLISELLTYIPHVDKTLPMGLRIYSRHILLIDRNCPRTNAN